MYKIAVLRECIFEMLSKKHLQRPITTLGSGAGKGGGGGGSIRESGGKLGEMGAAREEEYFRKKNAELLQRLKSETRRNIEQHKKLIATYSKSKEEIFAKLKKLSGNTMTSEEMEREAQKLKDMIESHKKALQHAEQIIAKFKKVEDRGKGD